MTAGALIRAVRRADEQLCRLGVLTVGSSKAAHLTAARVCWSLPGRYRPTKLSQNNRLTGGSKTGKRTRLSEESMLTVNFDS